MAGSDAAAGPHRRIRLARVFDRTDATGPGFDPGHPTVTDATERAAILAFLHAGHPLLATPALMADACDPGRGAVVPTNVRTDGRWIWTDAVAYYLNRHWLAPEPDLLAHLRHRAYRVFPVDGAVLRRAMDALREAGGTAG